MLKKRVLALVLALALLPLPGCAAMLERGHETVTTHVDYAVTEDESVLRAETYQGLVSAMLYFVNGHRRGAPSAFITTPGTWRPTWPTPGTR